MRCPRITEKTQYQIFDDPWDFDNSNSRGIRLKIVLIFPYGNLLFLSEPQEQFFTPIWRKCRRLEKILQSNLLYHENKLDGMSSASSFLISPDLSETEFRIFLHNGRSKKFYSPLPHHGL